MKIRAGAICAVLLTGLSSAASAQVPAGMTPLIRPDLKGWHWSRTSHHGTVGKATVEDGVLYLTQQPYGQGGLLLTDKRYKNFELYLETKVPWAANSGIFLRSTEGGSAYQIELTQFGGTAALIGEAMLVPQRSPASPRARELWKEDWNSFRIRVEGDAPKITLWLNGEQLWEVQQPKNTKIALETDGRIGLQLHWMATYQPELTGRADGRGWKPGDRIAFRNIAVRELP